jgi:hypothetical protein
MVARCILSHTIGTMTFARLSEREGGDVAKKHRQREAEAWAHAKRVCRLNGRQVKMARALDMNPKKLPGLRPSPQQRWKLPVGEFIEECYWKRFGGSPWDHEPREPKPGSGHPSTEQVDAGAPPVARDPMWQAQELICYLMNLADDLQRWISHETLDPEVLPQVAAELREIAGALDTGAVIAAVPGIPLPSELPAAPRRDADARTYDDDIPF